MPKGDAGPLGRLGRGVNKSATVIGRQRPAERWFIMEQGLVCAFALCWHTAGVAWGDFLILGEFCLNAALKQSVPIVWQFAAGACRFV